MKLDDKRDPTYWRAIKPATSLTLTDEQALREDVSGQHYIVKTVTKLREKSGVCEWLLFEIIGQDDAPNSWLMVKIAGEELSLRVFFEDPDFESGNRLDMLEEDNRWLFQEPDDPDDFSASELVYAKHVGWDFPGEEEGDDDIHVDYNVKTGELQADVSCDPRETREDELLATVVEYDTSDPTTCPELLVLEIGNIKNSVDEGGYIRLFFGNDIKPTEVDVLAVTHA